jgi:hypothetical protein
VTITENRTNEVLPAVFEHARIVYREMQDHASRKSLDSGESVIVYEGRLTKLICEDLRYSVPYYTSIRKALQTMGCIRQLRRGGGSTPSQWELITEPTRELFFAHEEALRDVNVGKRAVASQIADLENEVGSLKQRLRDVQSRLDNRDQVFDQLIAQLRRKGVL